MDLIHNRKQFFNLLRYTIISFCILDFYGFLRILMDSYGFLWVPSDSKGSFGFLWLPMDSYGFPPNDHNTMDSYDPARLWQLCAS
jgi:hypothetical protein